MGKHPIYRVVFINNGKTYEIYASNVNQSHLYGFVEIDNLLFDERSSLVVDPAEEKLKAEFEGVSKTNIPMHAVIRIDEVAKQGTAKITEANGNVVTPLQFPAGGKKKE